MKETARQRMDTPRGSRLVNFRLDVDLGRSGERAARFLGTGRYLAIQTGIVIVWIFLNVAALSLQWDPYPFILLNLAFSTQAAYAAPLILLAQNRQDDRDRVSLEEDRARAQQTKADTEFLARELASLRIAVGEVATRDYLRRELEEIREMIEQLGADPTPQKKSRKKQQSRKRDEPADAAEPVDSVDPVDSAADAP